ncbi:sulfurtransferase complex subunit TusD [Buchnera aphidicola (Ceratoglyphina bambusae)]|uniref:sulfurtransferase complex subunit TusD n=1 Tax=Buchnera aphidicola TaxID=9 RepID=UPI0031B7FEE5
MKFTILVTGPCYGTQNSISAFLFSKNLLKKGHTIKSIFFYSDGIYNSNIMNFPSFNEINLLKFWKKLSIKFNVKLKVCMNSCLNRGVITNNFALKKKIPFGNLDMQFEPIGFVELSKIIIKSDRIIQF